MAKLIRFMKKMPDKSGYLLILPFFIIFIYFWITPIVSVITDSFTDYQLFGAKSFTGIDNYIKAFSDTTRCYIQ